MARSYSFDALNQNRSAHREAAEMLQHRRYGVSNFDLGPSSPFALGAALLVRLGSGAVVFDQSIGADRGAPQFVFA